MKHLKEKLIATIAMLLVATVMLTSASFAWFTISTNPEISNIQTSAAANENLEIALKETATQTAVPESNVGDSGKNTTWGNLVDLSAIAEAKLYPAVVEGGTFKYPTYGLDGRTDSSAALTPAWKSLTSVSDYTDGGYYLLEDAKNNPYGIRVDFFMRTNEEGGKITLQEEAKDRGAGTDNEGGTVVNDNLTVAFSVDNGPLSVKINDGSIDNATIIESAKANQVYLVSMYIYVDAAGLKNADVAKELTGLTANVQFTSDKVSNAFVVQGDGHQKPTTT